MTTPNRRIEQSEEAQIRGATARIAREGVPMDEAKFRAENTEAFRDKVRKTGQALFGAPEATQSAQAESSAVVSEKKRELTPKQADQLLGTLKVRFETPSNKKLRKAIDFADVEKSLRAAPEKLYALQKLEETGGEPQVIGIDGDEFVFEDRSAESPSGRRDLDADQAAAQAGEFGADMQSPDAYRAMQKTGKFDLNTRSWLKTDPKRREETGYALSGHRVVVVVFVRERDAGSPGPYVGWRASLRVKKV